MQCEEPATSLIHAFCNKICRINFVRIEQLFVFKRIMNLSVRHRTRIKPHINQVCLALHWLTAFRDKNYIIYIWPVNIYFIVVVTCVFSRFESFCSKWIFSHKPGCHRAVY